jgi:hypothetical protein
MGGASTVVMTRLRRGARWGTLHSVLPLHWEKPGADFGFLPLERAARSCATRNSGCRIAGTLDGAAAAHERLSEAQNNGSGGPSPQGSVTTWPTASNPRPTLSTSVTVADSQRAGSGQ